MIKLLALDLDGTTLNTKGEIPDANRAAIRAAEEMGVLVTIATGRRFRDAQPVGIDLGLNAPIVTHNGALIKFAESEVTVKCDLLSTATSVEIVRAGKDLGGDALVSTDPYGKGTLLYDRISEDNLALKKYLRWSENLHGGRVGRDGVEHVPNLAGILHEHKIVHISFSGACLPMLQLETSLRAELGKNVTILATIYTHLDFTLLDLLPPEASKGHGVAKLAEINGLTAENVMTIGDNFNDLEMLNYAGTPVVMGNADARLREMPNFYTTLSNDESGVAVAIERFILNQESI